MSSVLFDTPGPKARRRHLLLGGLWLVVLAGVGAWAFSKLSSAGVLTSEVFEGVFAQSNVDFILEGFKGTLKAAALGIAGAIGFGLVFSAGRLSEHRIFRWPSVVVIEFFRAVPLVLLIIAIWFQFESSIGTMMSLVIALTLYNGSVLAEVFRAGVNAVPTGQAEAAYALGMRKTLLMWTILLPQAVKFMLPAIVSQCVIILKDTSLGYIILYPEAVRNAKQVAQYVPDGAFLTYVSVAAVFIVINYSLSKVAEFLERRLASRGEKPLDAEALEI